MLSLPPEELDTLIDRYLTGDLDAATAEQVRGYLDATPGRRGVMAGVRAAIQRESIGESPKDAVAARHALLARLDATLQTPGESTTPSHLPSGREQGTHNLRSPLSRRQRGWQGRQPLRRWRIVLGCGAFLSVAGYTQFARRPVHRVGPAAPTVTGPRRRA
jgi:hypothetical protein